MGNRVTLKFTNEFKHLYAHWNGGPESFVAAIKFAINELGATKNNLGKHVCEIYKSSFSSKYDLQDLQEPICPGDDNGDWEINWYEGDKFPTITKLNDGDFDVEEFKPGIYSLESLLGRLKHHEYWANEDNIVDHIRKKHFQEISPC